MSEELETVLRLVADGTLTPEQAAPIIDALTRAEQKDRREPAFDIPDRVARGLDRAHRRLQDAQATMAEHAGRAGGRQLRIRVTEHGRQVVNLRIPIGFVDTALKFVPGIGGDQSERIREAVDAGVLGPIIDVESPDGDSVLISVE
ncbi:MAG: hypothetical protein K5924_12085 [Chloroflexi bacterium]|nr:hypothetical protein [Chloroflexota bacterium]